MAITTLGAVEPRRRAIPLGVIPYSQSTISEWTGRRADCSGLISYAWDLPTSGDGVWLKAYSTESLWRVGLIKEIPRSELRPGDAIGYCGPGTANGGGGHIALFMAADGDRVRIWDHGSGMGPKNRWVTWDSRSTGWLAPGRCKAWRYVGNTTEEDDMTPDQEKALWATDARVRSALIDGVDKIPDLGYGKEVPVWIVGAIKDIQTRLKALEQKPTVTVDAKAVAAELAKLLPAAPTADQVADKLAARLKD